MRIGDSLLVCQLSIPHGQFTIQFKVGLRCRVCRVCNARMQLVDVSALDTTIVKLDTVEHRTFSLHNSAW